MSKPIAKSKTAHGAIVALILGLLAIFGVDVAEGEIDQVAHALALIISFAWTLYGRIRASENVRGLLK
jgi:hypothetical protein